MDRGQYRSHYGTHYDGGHHREDFDLYFSIGLAIGHRNAELFDSTDLSRRSFDGTGIGWTGLPSSSRAKRPECTIYCMKRPWETGTQLWHANYVPALLCGGWGRLAQSSSKGRDICRRRKCACILQVALPHRYASPACQSLEPAR